MKLTLQQLVDSQGALNEFAAKENLPAKTSYWAGKVLTKAERELKHFQEARTKCLESFGTLPAGGAKYVFETPEKEAECVAQLKELAATEIELPGEPFTLEKLGPCTLTPAAMMALDWLIVE